MKRKRRCSLTFGKMFCMEINITKTAVYDYALALTARVGAQSESYSQLAITKDNYPMLDVYMSGGLHTVEAVFRKHLSASTDLNVIFKGEEATIMLSDSAGIDGSVHNLIETGVRLYLAYYIAACWLQGSAAQSASDAFMQTATDHLTGAVKAANTKIAATVEDHDYSARKDDDVMFGRAILPQGELLVLMDGEHGADEAYASSPETDFLISTKP